MKIRLANGEITEWSMPWYWGAIFHGLFPARELTQTLLAKLKRPIVKNPLCKCGEECYPGETDCEDCFIESECYLP